MASPFSIFRKNQKVMMALLVGLSMFAFIVIDSLTPENFPIFLGAVLGALALWLLSGKGGNEGWLIAAVGAVLGAVVGVYGPNLLHDNTAVDTAHGSLSYQDIEQIAHRQSQANRFLGLAFMTAREKLPEDKQRQLPEPELFGFASPADPQGRRETAVMTYLFGKEADELGIEVTDQTVNRFIIDVTGGHLSDADLRRIRNEMQIGTGELIDILREQIRAREAYQLLAPRVGPTPHALWADFKKLSTEAKVAAVSIPTEAFLAAVDDPAPNEVAQFFERHKAVPPSADGTPGFLVPRQVQVAYFEIPLDEIRQSIEPPTDEEVRAFYDRTSPSFDLGPDLPSASGGATTPGDRPPIEAPRVAPSNESGEAAPAQPPSESTSDPATGSETSSSSPNEPAASEKPAQPESTPGDEEEKPTTPEGDDAAKIRTSDLHFVLFQEEEEATQTGDAAAPSTDEPAADSPETAPESAGAPPLQPPSLPAPPQGENSTTAREPSAATLEAIREDLINQRAREAADARLEQVREDVYDMVHRIMDEVPLPEDPRDEEQSREYEQNRRDAVKKVVAEMEAYAQKNPDVKFFTTPLLSADELLESDDYPIGQAVRWERNASPFDRDTTPIAQILFQMSPEQPLNPIAAQSMLNESRFVALKVDDAPPRVPSLDDEGIRERVVEAWKLQQARERAKERAEELAAAVAKNESELESIAAEATVTGGAEGEKLTAQTIGPFSWLRRTTAPATDFSLPEIVPTTLPELPAAGEKFMQAVFEEIEVGKAGVAPAEDGSAFYVVQVKERGSEEQIAKAREEFLRENFFRHPLDSLFGFPMNPFRRRIVMEAQEAHSEWLQNFRTEHNVQYMDITAPQT